jgi:hypothetical protein
MPEDIEQRLRAIEERLFEIEYKVKDADAVRHKTLELVKLLVNELVPVRAVRSVKLQYNNKVNG